MSHGCPDGAGNPYDPSPDQALMGYKLRTEGWAYICWFGFEWGAGGDPKGDATYPLWDEISARELYSHHDDSGTGESGERLEWENLAYEPEHQALIEGPGGLHAQLVAAVKLGLVKPILAPGVD